MTNALRITLAVAMAALSGCAHHAYEAYNTTPIFGASRRVIKTESDFAYQFAYRGGLVTYLPSAGARWSRSAAAPKRSHYSGPSGPGQLPNGCLVYACSRAEEIRLHPRNRESGSQVICYSRADGSGHAFVLYQRAGRTVAEDNRGIRTFLPSYKNRSGSQALYLASIFQQRSGGLNSSPAVQAAFVGRY